MQENTPSPLIPSPLIMTSCLKTWTRASHPMTVRNFVLEDLCKVKTSIEFVKRVECGEAACYLHAEIAGESSIRSVILIFVA